MIRFDCAGCRNGLTASEDRAGKRLVCPDCDEVNTVPIAGPHMETIRCPECRKKLSVDVADLGSEVECPVCQSLFTARVDTGYRRGRSNDDDDDRHPRSRSRRDNTYDDDDDYPRRKKSDLTPLVVSSVIMGVLCFICGGFNVVTYVTLDQVKNVPGVTKDDLATLKTASIILAFTFLILSLIQIAGAIAIANRKRFGVTLLLTGAMLFVLIGIWRIAEIFLFFNLATPPILCGTIGAIGAFFSYAIYTAITLLNPKNVAGFR